MKKLLSLPPNLVNSFHEVTGLSREEYFCTSDPIGHRLGSGGGTTWLLEEAYREEAELPFDEWLSSEKRILLHAGGQSRRLPSYAPSGKILTPIPVFRWERGQKLSQTLLDIQLPLYERIMAAAPENIHTMIVSGDVYIRAADRLPQIPDVDVVCYGLWLDSSIAKDHGVFVSDRNSPNVLKRMLQKPTIEELAEVLTTSFYLTDIGVWLLSDRAVKALMKQTGTGKEIREYDLYSDFGRSLGTDPQIEGSELKDLTVAIIPLPEGAFYHYGTSSEMISSTLAVQNIVVDQRELMHHDRKPHPSIFTQNSRTEIRFTSENTNVWVENSHVPATWTITHDNIITGVPVNDWTLTLEPGQCLDIVPIGERQWAVRPYRIDDKFAGKAQQTPIFPLVNSVEEMGMAVKEMLTSGSNGVSFSKGAISAEEISDKANLKRLFAQRREFAKDNWKGLATNWEHSVFYQLDLDNAAQAFAENAIPMPKPLPDTAQLMIRIQDAMFRGDEQKAFGLLREGILNTDVGKRGIPSTTPHSDVYSDQIVWARSPVRIDIAGGWTDTPPYCLMEGGRVINLAIELNGQPPIQTYVRKCSEEHIVLRSIDLGATEIIENYEQLTDFHHVGSPFSIPKAALVLAGVRGGVELTTLSAIPAGSGLGTSSVLAATVLGALNDFCSLGWDKNEIGRRTLMLEQMLTTGGGWQDQFGGVFGGVKLLETSKGFDQSPVIHWLPDEVFTNPEYARCHLLYYTGITRTAKNILAEIVRRMFLNEGQQLRLLREMKAHTMDMYDAIQRHDFTRMGKLVGKTWQQNQAIDKGTNPPEIQAITSLIDDFCLGYKLPGAGGGGYLYMIAKDPEAAGRIISTLNNNRPNDRARFVEMTLSKTGLQISRS